MERAPYHMLQAWLKPFRSAFTAPSFANLLVILTGTLLAPARRTISSALHLSGLATCRHFTNYHRFLNRAAWSGRDLSHRLLLLLVAWFVPQGPVIIGIDDTLERRWGRRILARGIYRDPVRSSHGHFVKAADCAGFRPCFWLPSPGPGASGPCHS